MIIAISIDNNHLNTPISAYFGRCEWFCLFDTTKGEYTFGENPACDQQEKAGYKAADFLLQQHVEIVISGRFGSHVVDYFKRNNIQMVIPKLPKTLEELVMTLKKK